MNILFASPGYGIRSVGDDAMLVAIADGLKREGEFDAHALIRHCNTEEQRHHYAEMNVCAWPNLDHANREMAKDRRFYGFNYGDPKPTATTTYIMQRMQAADVLVLGGGEVFLDITHSRWRGPVAYYELLVTLARFTGTPVVLAGASLPKFRAPEDAADAMRLAALEESTLFILDNCDHVILRDHTSAQNAIGLGFTGEIEVLPDPAIGLEPKEAPWIEPFFRDCRKPWIGVALRWPYWQDVEWHDFCDYWAGICDTLSEELGGTVVFIPHNLYDVDDRRLDDRFLAEIIQGMMRSPSTALEHYADPREYLAVYKRLDLVVAMRHHGAVLGVRAGVPTVAVPYSEKTTAFCIDIGEWNCEPGESVTRAATIRYTRRMGPTRIAEHRKAWYRYIEVINDVARR
jgi:polysaccharide pyruvyl transferase WcaK-like protein